MVGTVGENGFLRSPWSSAADRLVLPCLVPTKDHMHLPRNFVVILLDAGPTKSDWAVRSIDVA